MAAPSSRRRKPHPRFRGLSFRALAAIAVLALVACSVFYLVWRAAGPKPARHEPGEMVRQVAARFGCPPGRVTTEITRDRNGTLFLATVHAPRGFPTDRFALDLEAAAHNLGGALEPQPLAEKGGYGLSRLEGVVDGLRWRVLVLGEEPPPVRSPRAAARGGRRVARLAIVLDDAGASEEVVRELERLPLAVAVAVLPNAIHSAEVARALGAQGREVLLHMPMEPLANQGPGPGDGSVDVGPQASSG